MTREKALACAKAAAIKNAAPHGCYRVNNGQWMTGSWEWMNTPIGRVMTKGKPRVVFSYSGEQMEVT